MNNSILKLNTRLAADLGRVATGQGLYKWQWSEDPCMQHPMRVQGEYEYKANPETGIIAAGPVYTLRKMCLTADHQWVLCHWIEVPSESEWRKLFGYNLEWPRNGQYYPTTVVLDPGVEPCIELTQTAIDCIRQQRNVSPAEVERRAAETIEKKDARNKVQLYDRIRNDLPTYDHVEGAKDAISYPSWGTKEENANDHSKQPNDSVSLPA
jgi:hypothetical protein